MISPPHRRWSRVLGEEDSSEEQEGSLLPADDTGSEAAAEPDYSFEGYSVEFIDKVALMPISQQLTATAQWRRRR